MSDLASRLREKVSHYECEDCWYSCPKSGECCNKNAGTDCTCGADDENALREEAAAALEARDRDAREIEVLRYEKERLRSMFEGAIDQLTSIYGLVHPAPFKANGKWYSFHPSDELVRETWEALSKAIREIKQLQPAPDAALEARKGWKSVPVKFIVAQCGENWCVWFDGFDSPYIYSFSSKDQAEGLANSLTKVLAAAPVVQGDPSDTTGANDSR